jgi:hypothetical protein
MTAMKAIEFLEVWVTYFGKLSLITMRNRARHFVATRRSPPGDHGVAACRSVPFAATEGAAP